MTGSGTLSAAGDRPDGPAAPAPYDPPRGWVTLGNGRSTMEPGPVNGSLWPARRRRLVNAAASTLAGILLLGGLWAPAGVYAQTGEDAGAAGGDARAVALEPAGEVTPSRFPIVMEPVGELETERMGPLEVWRLPGTGLGPFDLAIDDGILWLTLYGTEGMGEVGVGRIDLDTRTFSRIDLPGGMVPYTMRLAPDGSLWVSDYQFSADERQRHVLRLDPAAGIADAYPLPDPRDGVTDFAFTPDGRVWLANYAAGGLLRLDAARGTVERLPTPPPEDSNRSFFTGAFRLTLDDAGRLWAVESIWDRLARIRPEAEPAAAGLELFPLPHGITSPVGIVVDGDTVWTTEHPGTRLVRWQPPAGESTVVQLWPTTDEGYPVAGPNDLMAGPDGSVWAVVHFVSRLARVLPGEESVNEFFLPPAFRLPPTRVLPLWGDVAGDGAVWTAAYGADALVRLDPDLPVARVAVDGTDVDLTAGGGPETIRLRLTFDGTWPEDWRLLTPALAGDDLPAGITVTAEPQEITARPGESVDVTLTVTAAREAAPGDYPVVAGARNSLFAAHRTLTLRVAPAESLTGTIVLAAGAALLWALALFTAVAASRGDAPRG